MASPGGTSELPDTYRNLQYLERLPRERHNNVLEGGLLAALVKRAKMPVRSVVQLHQDAQLHDEDGRSDLQYPRLR